MRLEMSFQMTILRRPCVNICNPWKAPFCIVFPFHGNNFNFQPGMVPLLPKFHGVEYANPYVHLKEFEEVCATFHDQTYSEELLG